MAHGERRFAHLPAVDDLAVEPILCILTITGVQVLNERDAARLLCGAGVRREAGVSRGIGPHSGGPGMRSGRTQRCDVLGFTPEP
eukprot:351505-Chlamydomonas_euryale.AAC.4